MAEIIDIRQEQEKRFGPDPRFVTVGPDGKKWFMFVASYKDEDREFAFQFWALDMEDAERRVQLMRSSLKLDGQLYAQVES